MTTTITVLTDEVRTAPARFVDGRPVVERDDLEAALGWKLTGQGFCRDDRCIRVRSKAALQLDGGYDLVASAKALGRTSVVDVEARLVAVAADPRRRRAAMYKMEAPDFVLPDLDGVDRALSDWHGRKRLLVAFASW